MNKKEALSAKAGMLFTFLIFSTTILAANAAASTLRCDFQNTACDAGEIKVLGLSSPTNAHAEQPGQTNYDWNVCCRIQGNPGVTLSTSLDCNLGVDGDAYVTGLSSSDGTGVTNAHLEKVGSDPAGPPHSTVCLNVDPGSIVCTTEQNPCPGGSWACLFSQSAEFNAHGAIAEDPAQSYNWNTACQFFNQQCGQRGQACCPGGTCSNPKDTCTGGVCRALGGIPGQPSTLFGFVTNASGIELEGATVQAVGHVSDLTDSTGRYELTLSNPEEDSPYTLSASYPGYETLTHTEYYLPPGFTQQQDFELQVGLGECTNECTLKGSNVCSAACHGRGSCWFQSPETMNVCDGKFGWTEIPDGSGRYVNCCQGAPVVPTKADLTIPCAENIVKTQKSVLYLGKLVKMNVVVFNPDEC